MSIKVVWLCNTLVPELCDELHIKKGKPESWITGIYHGIKDNNGYELIYLFPSNKKIDVKKSNLRFISYTQHKEADFEKVQVAEFVTILLRFEPDIIHCFGTELPHTYAMVCAASKTGNQQKVVVSIQGLISLCAEHYYAYLPVKILKKRTTKDILKNTNIIKQRRVFEKRAMYEKKVLQEINHVIGRTELDKAFCKLYNANIEYHFCNEILRDSFYEGKWEKDVCQRYSIFVSQSIYPLKGFHLMLEAMPYILKKYPTAHLYTTGNNPLHINYKNWIQRSYYNVYIGKLIKKYHLQDSVTFLGFLNEAEMKQQFLNANVFVNCSSIENSPNSVCEAMMLGVPIVSSNVGGVKDFIQHGENGYLYQADAPYMLAYYVMKVFDEEDYTKPFYTKSIAIAEEKQNRETNMQRLFEIYKTIANQ